MMLHCCQYGIVVAAYFPLELDKHLDAAVLGPFYPSVQFFLGDSDILALENKTEFLFWQIGTIQPLVSLGNEFKLSLLFLGEMLRSLSSP